MIIFAFFTYNSKQKDTCEDVEGCHRSQSHGLLFSQLYRGHSEVLLGEYHGFHGEREFYFTRIKIVSHIGFV